MAGASVTGEWNAGKHGVKQVSRRTAPMKGRAPAKIFSKNLLLFKPIIISLSKN